MITPLARRDRQGGRGERGRGASAPATPAGALESTDIGLNPWGSGHTHQNGYARQTFLTEDELATADLYIFSQ